MNFKDFKKIDTTATHTIFKHKDGHLLHVANDKLPKELKKEMKDIPTQSVMERLREEKKVQKMNQGGMAQLKELYNKKMADGGEVEDYIGDDDMVQMGEPEVEYSSSTPSLSQLTPEMKEALLAQASEQTKVSQANLEKQAAQEKKTKGAQEAAEYFKRQYGVEFPELQAVVPKEAKPALSNVPLPGAATPEQAAQAPVVTGAGEMMGLEGAMQQIAGAQGIAAGQQEAAAAQAEAMDAALKQRQQALNDLKQIRERTVGHVESLRRDLEENKLDPSRVLGSGSERVFKTIGLILGGLATTATGGMAAPLNLIKREMDEDIAKQKSEIDTKNNLLGYNLKLLGNIEEAEALTRLQYADTINFISQRSALKSAGKEAQSRAQLFAGQIQQQIMAPIMSQIEQRAAAQSMMSKEPSSPTQVMQRINMLPPGQRRMAVKEYGEYQGIVSRMDQAKNVMQQQAKINTLAHRMLSPVQTSRLMANQKTQLFDIVKGIVGEKMTDQDVKSLVDPLILRLYDSPQTADALTDQLLNTLKSKSKERMPTLILNGIDLPFPVKATPIPTRKK